MSVQFLVYAKHSVNFGSGKNCLRFTATDILYHYRYFLFVGIEHFFFGKSCLEE